MNKSLFSIEAEYLKILEEFENTTEDGIMDEATIERLNINKDELVEKLENYRLFIKSIEGDIAGVKDEVDRLNGKIKTKENVINSLKMLMKTALQMYGDNTDKGTKKLKLKTFTIWTVKTMPVIIEDEETFEDSRFTTFSLSNKIPSTLIDKVKEFFNGLEILPILNKSISKADIKKALKEGEVIEGASLDDVPTSLNMR